MLRNKKGVQNSLSWSLFQLQNHHCSLLTKLQSLEVNPLCERGAAHLIAALHTNAVVGGVLQALHAIGKGGHWGDFSGDLLAIWGLSDLCQA